MAHGLGQSSDNLELWREILLHLLAGLWTTEGFAVKTRDKLRLLVLGRTTLFVCSHLVEEEDWHSR